MKTDNKKLTKATKLVFDSLEVEDFVTVDKSGNVLIDFKKIPAERLKVLQEECSYIERTEVWKILTNSIGMVAKDRMFNKSETFDDMLVGKITLYVISLQIGIMNKLRDYLGAPE